MDRKISTGCLIKCLIATSLPFIVPALFIILFLSPNVPGIDFMKDEFDKNREDFYLIIEYLLNSDFSDIRIHRSSQLGSGIIEMFVWPEMERIVVSDPNVSDAINRLFGQGYRSINKSGNGISFLRWTTLDAGRGIVFSIDGSSPTQADGLQFLIEIQPLSEDGWYFYVDDFNVWRSRNR